MKTPSSTWLAGLALAALVGCGQAGAQADGASLLLLSNLYGEAVFNTASQVCSQRFPDQAGRWQQALSGWRTRHAALLAEFRDLDAQLSAAVRVAPAGSRPTSDELLALRTQPVVWMLAELAKSGDAKARTLCDDQHQLLGDDARIQASAGEVRKAVQDLLARLRAGTR